jgi:hypothetical protein
LTVLLAFLAQRSPSSSTVIENLAGGRELHPLSEAGKAEMTGA